LAENFIMPVPTDQLAEKIKDLREANQRLAEAIRDLGREFASFRVDNAEKLGAINTNLRVDVAQQLGAINTNLRVEVAQQLGLINSNVEALRARVESSLSVAKRFVGVVTPIVIALVGFAIGATWYAAKLDSRVERVEKRLDKEPGEFSTTQAIDSDCPSIAIGPVDGAPLASV
jgi:hypothetical protein